MIPVTARRAGTFAVSKLATRLIAFFVLLYVARKIGPGHFGAYTYLISVVSLLLPFSSLGMLGEVYRKRVKKGFDAIREVALLYVIAVLGFSVIAGAVVLARGYSVVLAVLTGTLLAVMSLYDFMTAAHFVKNRVRQVSIANITERLIFILFVVVLPPRTSSLVIAAITASLVLDVWLFKKIQFRPEPRLNFSYFSWAFLFASVFNAAAARLPPIIFDSRFGVVSLGMFGAAITLQAAATLLITESFKFIVLAAGSLSEEGWKRLKKYSVLLAGALLVVVLAAWPVEVFIGDLLFGTEYSGVGLLFAYAMLSVPAFVLEYYPRAKLTYESPNRYAATYFLGALAAAVLAASAPDIYTGALLWSGALWIKSITFWLMAGTRIPATST